jgi:hypothetical protein
VVFVDEDHAGGLERGGIAARLLVDGATLPFSKSAMTWRGTTARRASSARSMSISARAAGKGDLKPIRDVSFPTISVRAVQ